MSVARNLLCCELQDKEAPSKSNSNLVDGLFCLFSEHADILHHLNSLGLFLFHLLCIATQSLSKV